MWFKHFDKYGYMFRYRATDESVTKVDKVKNQEAEYL